MPNVFLILASVLSLYAKGLSLFLHGSSITSAQHAKYQNEIPPIVGQIRTENSPTLSVSNVTICLGKEATLQADYSSTLGVSFTWLPGSLTGSLIIVTPQITSVYTLIVNDNGNQTVTMCTVYVDKKILPQVNFKYASPVCQSVNLTQPELFSDFYKGGVFRSEGLAIDSASGFISVNKTPVGIYTVNYLLPAGTCYGAKKGTATIEIEKEFTLGISEDVKIGTNSSIEIFASGGSNYLWEPSTGLSCNDCPNTMAAPKQSTKYCVIEPSKNCVAKACVNVIVGCEGQDFSVPNAFSPNGDMVNDSFCLKGWNLCVSSFLVLIFNRWGEKVYESTNPNFCWDGIYKDKILEADVYACRIDAFFSGNNRVIKNGSITLLK